jgi:hypothetical protein
MRVHTHVVFSTAVALWFVTTWQTVLLSPLTTVLIDALGHTKNHGIPHRIWLTHDWLLSLPIFILPLSWVYTWTPLFHVTLLTAFIINTTTLYTHLMLDGMTGHTFIMTKRIGHAIVEWDNPVANGLFIVLGIVLIAYRFHLIP